MKVELLTTEQLSDLAQSGQTDILEMELFYSDYLAKYANYEGQQDLVITLCEYINQIQPYLS